MRLSGVTTTRIRGQATNPLLENLYLYNLDLLSLSRTLVLLTAIIFRRTDLYAKRGEGNDHILHF
jgi:hypothetical protein